MDYDSSNIPSAYDAGREISQQEKYKTLKFFTENLSIDKISNVIDLGCGTGRFSGALSELFDANVVGIDPSEKMLNQARIKHQNISFKIASGEQLPLDESTTDMIFMSMVLHHLNDHQKTVSECHRVLRPDGVVCIRNTFADEISTYPYLDVFPSMGSIIESQLISREKFNRIFFANGFELLAHQIIWDKISPNWQAFADKIALKVDSFVARLNEEEFQSGLMALQDKAKSAGGEKPVGLNVDSFIFQKCE